MNYYDGAMWRKGEIVKCQRGIPEVEEFGLYAWLDSGNTVGKKITLAKDKIYIK